MKFFEVVKSFFKVGVIGFGGGTALIPVVEKEVVDQKHFVTPEKFGEELVLQGITPGAFPIKMGVGIGLQQSALCAVVSAFAVSLFGAVATVLIMMCLGFAGVQALQQIGYVSVGISAFIVVLIYKFVAKTVRSAKNSKSRAVLLGLFVFTIIFGCADKVQGLLASFGANANLSFFPQLSTINIILLGIVVSMFTGLDFSKTKACTIKWVMTAVLGVLMLVFCTNNPIVKSQTARVVVFCILGAMAVFAVSADLIVAARAKRADVAGQVDNVCSDEAIDDVAKTKLSKMLKYKRPLIAIAYMMVLPVVLVIILFAVGGKGFDLGKYINNCILSTATTFGGGTAFIGVGEGVFVQSGFISAKDYWEVIMPVGNALPGALLVKVLAAIGYSTAFVATASIGYSLAVATLGAILGIATTAILYLIIYMIFLSFKKLTIFESLRLGILPIIAGLLVPTIVSMLASMTQTVGNVGISPFFALPIIGFFLAIIPILNKKTKIPDFFLIIGCGLVSMGLFNAIYALC